MKLWDRVKARFGPRRQKNADGPAWLRAKYDAAQTTDENVNHWANADGLSAVAAADPAVRKKLRNRARYECQESNGIAKGIILTRANDTIGTGPTLQMVGDDEDLNEEIEVAFAKWAKATDYAEKLRTVDLALTVDGEAFGWMINNPAVPGPVKLDIRLIEAEQVSTPLLFLEDDHAVDGIRFDDAGNPIEYHVLKIHPGSDQFVGISPLDKDDVPAEFMLHLFRKDRPGQRRGIPEITPALPLGALHRRWNLATVMAAETAASYAGVLETDSAAIDDDAVDPEIGDAIPIALRSLLTVPHGWKMSQLKAEHPSTTHEMFHMALVNMFARCLNMPLNIALGNSKDYNYASGRLDHQMYFKSIRVRQSEFDCQWNSRVFEQWLREYMLQVHNQSIDIDDFAHDWFYNVEEHVDPQKEANAQKTLLESHSTTYAQVFARQGKDWRKVLRQRGKELALMRELNIPLPDGTITEDTDDEEEDGESRQRTARALAVV